MVAGEYRCPCRSGLRHTHGRTFTRPLIGKLTTVEGEFDIYGPHLSHPTWTYYPAGAKRKERRKLDTKRRKAQRKRRTTAW